MRGTWQPSRQLRAALVVSLGLVTAISGSLAHAGSQNAIGNAIDIGREVQQARQITRKFERDLRLELTRALKTRGLVAAIGAYHAAAPEIASRESEESGFEVRRIALKLRNPENAAVGWERKSLQTFITKRKQGADPKQLEQYELVRAKGGDRRFRYMKAIVVNNSCLGCHGPDLKDDVTSEIAKYYHDDKSKGFRRGDIIGAYSLVKVIE